MFFLFNDTATTEIYTYGHTLSLHDALPISVERGESGIGDIIAAIGEPAARRIDIGCIDIGRRARIAVARTDGDEVNGPFGKGANREGREIAMAEAAIRTEPAFGVVEREGGLDREAGVAKVEDAHLGPAAMKAERERAP